MSPSKDSPRTNHHTAAPTSFRIEGLQPDGVEHLTAEECWRLIEGETFGRLAVTGRDGAPDVFPLNYTVHDGSIYIRSAPGAKLRAIAAHPVAALEIDGEDAGFRWSVVARGAARRLATDQEIHESGVQRLVSSSPTPKYNYICVTPSSVSGRRFFDRPGASPAAPQRRDLPASFRPILISHFPPQ